MQNRWVVSFELIVGRDDTIIDGLSSSPVSNSAICREALRLYFERDDKLCKEIAALRDEIVGLQGGVATPPAVNKVSNSNPFGDTEL